jgi:aspartyl protease family protein
MEARWIAGVIVTGAAVGFLVPTGKPSPSPAPVVAAKPAPGKATSAEDTAKDTMVTAPRKTVLYRNSDGHFYTDALVNGSSVHFVVDTGASFVALTSEDARKIGIPFDRSEFEVIGRGASGDVRGKVITLHHIAIGRQEGWDVEAAIIDKGLDVSLLGQSWLGVVDSVQISGETMTLG